MPVKITVNGRTETVDAEPDTPLLWVIRDELGLTGTTVHFVDRWIPYDKRGHWLAEAEYEHCRAA